MEKVRIYELAKELNTTSKRLIEKLAEINISVKNHMSYLEGNEVKALYKHIGVISHDEDKKGDDLKSGSTFTPRNRTEPKKHDKKDIPRIIRTTEITSSSSTNNDGQKESNANDNRYRDNENRRRNSGYQGGRGRNDYKSGRRFSGVKVSVASSGLRAGLVRETDTVVQQTLNKKTINAKQEEEVKQSPDKSKQKQSDEKDNQITASQANAATIPGTKTEQKAELKPKIKDKGQNKQNNKEAETKAEVSNMSETDKIKEDKVKEKEGKTLDNTKDQKTKTFDTNKDGNVANDNVKDDNVKDDVKLDSGSDIKNMPKEDKNKVSKVSNHDRSHHQKNDGHSSNFKQKSGRKNTNELKTLPKEILLSEVEEVRIDENKREFQNQNKDFDKDIKREQKRDVPRSKSTSSAKKKRIKPHNIIIDPTKGVSQILQEDELLIDELLETPKKSAAKKPKRSNKARKEKSVSTANNNDDPRSAAEKSALTSIKIGETITVKELAEKLKKTAADVIKKLMMLGTMVTLNQEIDFDVAAIIADEYGVRAEKEVVINEEDILFDDEEDDEDKLVPRPPVVVVMGHVDHGKTSLLDAIRRTNVIEKEEGGITQHIGAYTVKINDRNITFLDTPGHEAFTAMRARGAQVTDIAILVVAADDGVMPQTVEAINHAKAAGVTIIVAINKMDKPTANPDRVKQQLTEYGLVSEEWGGDITMVPISAKKNENIDLLLEMVLLTADIMELKANPDKQAKGTVIESRLDKNRGPVATLLVQRGTLNVGDPIITGTIFGRIRAMADDKGQSIKTAGPSTPVEILGLPEVPESGELFYAVKDEKLAKSLAEKRKQQQREENLKSSSMVSLEDLFNQIQEGNVKELNVIIKADVQGSVEAVKQSIEKLSNDEVKIKVIHGAVGGVTETDVKLAEVSNAIIIGFNVRPGPNVMEVAEMANVEIKLYRVIYDAINDIEAAMKGMLDPTLKEVIHGHVEIRQIYKASGIGTIGGAYVLDGKVNRNSSIRVVRDSIVIHEGKLASLKKFKDDVREVTQGYECGIVIERFNDIKVGDIIEAYAMEEVER